MSRAMDAWYEDMGRGYSSVGEKYVCSSCFDEYAIEQFIHRNAESYICDYCGNTSEDEQPIAASIDSVIELIVEGIKTEWGDPGDEGVGWESREGGWVGADVYDKWDLLKEHLDIGFRRESLFNDVYNSILVDQWCHKDPYGVPLGDEWLFDWEHFSRQLKHHTRYVFFKLPKRSDDSVSIGIEK